MGIIIIVMSIYTFAFVERAGYSQAKNKKEAKMCEKIDEIKEFINIFKNRIKEKEFIKLVLGKYRGEDSQLKKIVIKQLIIKNEERLSFCYNYKTKDITKNYSINSGIKEISKLIGDPFKSVNLFSETQDNKLEFSRKGKAKWSQTKASSNADSAKKHNREKNRYIETSEPFLFELGITDKNNQIIPSMSRKWKQINKFLEVFNSAFSSSQLIDLDDIHVVDFGSGKGYLTIAIHEYLRNTLNKKPIVTGIELRENLVSFCNDVSKKLKLESLNFHQGDIKCFTPEKINVMIALHACDIATDLAIDLGIRSNSEIIMCAPCCHKEIRKQIKSPEVLQPALSFGVHFGQEAEMITDTLRALLLEANGYKVQLFEFVSLEHTSKNKMLLGIKHNNKVNADKILEKVANIKEFYGIKEHHLETLLNSSQLQKYSYKKELI